MISYEVQEWGRPLQQVLSRTPEPQAAEVLVRVKACGVCHSDVHIREGAYDMGDGKRISLSDIGIHLPLTMGHEIVGVVEATGPLAQVQVGSECVVYPWIGCGHCRHCLHGLELDCEKPRSLGTRRAGGYADHVLVPDGRYVLPYDGVDSLVAASAACSGLTAYSALKKLPPLTSDDVVVLIGAGGLGLAALGLLPKIHDARVIMLDSDPAKLELARAKADAVLEIQDANSLAKVRELARCGGAAAVIDFVGLPQTFEWGLSALRKGGTMVQVGLFGGATSLSIAMLPMRHLKIIGSYVGSLQEFKDLLVLLKGGDIVMAPLLQRPMAEINDVFEEIRKGQVPGRVMAIA
ncbi:MAG: alcohol dehydrogenase [Burkholderiaceae bacterium]|nr:alcohol dehydrogenase [Burkholderiaceae bacterium]